MLIAMKNRGKEHTTLTETAAQVVRELKKLPGIKMIGPGEIKTNSRKGPGKRFITAVHTNAGLELIISGQSVQKVSVHCDKPTIIYVQLQKAKSLREFGFKTRDRKPET